MDYRDYALSLVDDGLIDERTLSIACLKYMSQDEVRDMLRHNELSPELLEED